MDYYYKYIKYKQKYNDLKNNIQTGGQYNIDNEIYKLNNKYNTPFKTFRKTPDNIYAIGDIHGDLGVMILTLETCGAIQYDSNYEPSYYNPDLNLTNLISSHNLKIKKNGGFYEPSFEEFFDPIFHNKKDLNRFKWSAKDIITVMLGDFIDRNRPRRTIFMPYEVMINNEITKRAYGEIPDEEYLILKFISHINKNGGRIIKLLGNHDIHNLTNDAGILQDYTTPMAKISKSFPNRYRILRDLYLDDVKFDYGGCGVICMIGQYIFTHADLGVNINDNNNIKYTLYGGSQKPINIFELNDLLYDKLSDNTLNPPKNKDFVDIISNQNGLVWSRVLSGAVNNKDIYCSNIGTTINKYLIPKEGDHITHNLDDNIITHLKNNIIMISAHCPQHDNSLRGDVNTFKFCKDVSSKVEIINNDDKNNKCNYDLGISYVECDSKPVMYRIDVGMSRAFYEGKNYQLPQILHINTKQKITQVIRCKEDFFAKKLLI